jgi:hypothetical protein
VVAIIGDDRDRFPVVARQHTLDGATPVRLERNPISDLELEHLLMSPHLLEESESLNDSAIEIDELRFGQLVDIDGHLLLRQHRAGQYPRTGGAVDQAALSHGLIASMGGPFGKDFVGKDFVALLIPSHLRWIGAVASCVGNADDASGLVKVIGSGGAVNRCLFCQ